MTGVQLSVVNIGGHVRGAQIGLLNVASEVDGLQLGVVNVARRNSGASVGLLPLVLEGYNRVALWSSDISLANLGVKLGSDHVYTLLGAGVTDDGRGTTDDQNFTFSFGFGAHITPRWRSFFFDADLVATSFWNRCDVDQDQARVLGTLRLMGGWQVARHLAVTFGPTYNVQTSWDRQDYKPGRGFAEKVIREGEATVRMWPGLAVGVQL